MFAFHVLKFGIGFAVITKLKTEHYKKMKYFLAFLSVAFGFSAMAQETSDPFGTSYNYDSTSFVDTSSYLESESKSNENPSAPTFLPYVRFKAPMDTITQKVTYMGVVPFKAMANDLYDGGNMDSLYWRAKKFLLTSYVKNFRAKATKDFVFPKDILVEDFKPDGDVGRIIITPTIPLVLRQGRTNSSQNGSITFKLEIRVKDDKYKYKVTNFVHHTKEAITEKPIDNYAEYYVNSKHSARSNDQILLAIDREVKTLVKALSAVMKDPIILDEDAF